MSTIVCCSSYTISNVSRETLSKLEVFDASFLRQNSQLCANESYYGIVFVLSLPLCMINFDGNKFDPCLRFSFGEPESPGSKVVL